ncbi:MAG: hypothetical protein PHU21_05875 [Elusimicrobia bacterium]|nr:hypothetical protein [Elusimicrobiota bacterium]
MRPTKGSSWSGPLVLTCVYWLTVLLLPPFQDVALNDDWAYASAVVTFKAPPLAPHELLAERSDFSPLSWRAERLYLYRRAAPGPQRKPR